jgi:hypothetical protein
MWIPFVMDKPQDVVSDITRTQHMMHEVSCFFHIWISAPHIKVQCIIIITGHSLSKSALRVQYQCSAPTVQDFPDWPSHHSIVEFSHSSFQFLCLFAVALLILLACQCCLTRDSLYLLFIPDGWIPGQSSRMLAGWPGVHRGILMGSCSQKYVWSQVDHLNDAGKESKQQNA